jgi:hypothetical protein
VVGDQRNDSQLIHLLLKEKFTKELNLDIMAVGGSIQNSTYPMNEIN